MENASNALIIAAGVLIGVLILSLAVYLFASFGEDAASIQALTQSNQLQQYNARFNVYVGRNDITIYQIVSLANLAREINESNKSFSDYETAYRIQVFLQHEGELSDVEGITYEQSQQLLQGLLQKYNEISDSGEQIGELKWRFTGVSAKYHSNGKIASIAFMQN